MPFLDIPRCPHCGHEVNPADLRREWGRRRSIFERTQWGIRCPDCKFVSKIRRTRAYIASLTALGIAIALGGSLAGTTPLWSMSDEGAMVAFGAVFAVFFLIQYRWVPLLVQLEEPAPGELLLPSRSMDEQLADEYRDEESRAASQEHEHWVESVNDSARKPWHCTPCGEENPATFDVCWKCQKPKESA